MIALRRHLGDTFPNLKALPAGTALAQAQQLSHSSADLAFKTLPLPPIVDHPGKIFRVEVDNAAKRRAFVRHNPAPAPFDRFADAQTDRALPVSAGLPNRLGNKPSPRINSEGRFTARLFIIGTSGTPYVQP